MADFDATRQVLSVKLVYYGPALSGKTTNLTQLHDMLSPANRSELMVLETQNDRTLFFDLLPIGIRTQSGMLVKIKLYTVPGQVQHDSTRKAILSRADGVVFVADSQNNQSTNNAESFQNLAGNLAILGIDAEQFPLVIQYNKRDLPGIVTEADINQRWQATPWYPVVYASALRGEGVRETLRQLLAASYVLLDDEYQLREKFQLSLQQFLGVTDAIGSSHTGSYGEGKCHEGSA
ncbi:MAG: GTPase domain-containing protein [Pseudomonadota bacterium]